MFLLQKLKFDSEFLSKENLIRKIYIRKLKKRLRRRKFKYVSKILNYSIFSYIISIRNTKSNIFFNISNIKGKVEFSITSGCLGFKGRQKKKYMLVLNAMVQKFLDFCSQKLPKRPKSFVVNCLYLSYFHENLLNKLFSKMFRVTLLKSCDLLPYNGCRPRKLKRRKKRRKSFMKLSDLNVMDHNHM